MKLPFLSRSIPDCDLAETIIDKHIDAVSLTLPEDAFLAVHLMACASCRHYDQSVRDIAQTLETMDASPMPESLIERIMMKLPSREAKRFHLPKAFPKTIAAVFFGAVVSLSLISYLATTPSSGRQSLSILPSTFSESNPLSTRTDDADALISMGTETPKVDAASSASLKDVVGF